MRPYLYALPFTLLLPACGAPEGMTTDGTTGTTGTTGSTTEAPTGTDGTATGTTTGTTDEPTTGTTGTGTTDEPSTGTTEGPPLVGDPSTYGEACAPDDGPATELKIDLAERLCESDWAEDVPLFRIVLFKGVDLQPGEHPLTGGQGFAYYDDGNGPLTGDVGTVVITEVTADGLRGTYDVTLSDNTQLSGSFDALYCPVDVLCG